MIASTSVGGEAFIEASNTYIRSAGLCYLCRKNWTLPRLTSSSSNFSSHIASGRGPHRNSPATSLQDHKTWKTFPATITASITFSAASQSNCSYRFQVSTLISLCCLYILLPRRKTSSSSLSLHRFFQPKAFSIQVSPVSSSLGYGSIECPEAARARRAQVPRLSSSAR